MSALRLMLVEDDATIRRGLARVLSASGFSIVAECGSAAEASAALARGVELELALVDLGLPDRSGLNVLAELRERRPAATLVVFTQFDDDEHIFGALRQGAVGYLLKSAAEHTLGPSLREAHEGGAPLSPGVARRVVAAFPRPAAASAEAGLTERQRAVLEELCRGKTYAEVGAALGMSLGTVQTHVKAIYQALHVSSKAEATRVALGRGLVSG